MGTVKRSDMFTAPARVQFINRTKWSLFPALTIDSLFNIDSEGLPPSGAFRCGSNMPFPGYFSEMFILVEK